MDDRDDVDAVAVIGACAPERAGYAARLAAIANRMLITAYRLGLAPDPLDEALALAPWTDRPAGAVIELPASTRADELIGALAAEGSGVRLSSVVCVADAAHLLADLRHDGYAARRLPRAPGEPGGPPIEYIAHAMLAVTQLEYASMILLVNWQGLSTPDLSTLMALVSHLSPRARLRLAHGATEAPEPGARYSVRQDRPGWVAILNGEHDPHMTDPRVTSLRYEQVRPLHPGRLQRLLDERVEPGEFGTVVRSAGMCRLATRPRVVAEWDHVGRVISFEPLDVDDRLRNDRELLAMGQELAVIGLDLRIPELVAALDEAALTDEEFAAGPRAWARLPDPFPAWQEVADGAG